MEKGKKIYNMQTPSIFGGFKVQNVLVFGGGRGNEEPIMDYESMSTYRGKTRRWKPERMCREMVWKKKRFVADSGGGK